jgi:hypothetical protein
MKNLISSQINAFSVSPKGMRWTNEDKLIALGLYYKSPSAYRFMRHTIRLPSESTLKSYISGFNVKTGFDSDYLLALKKRAEGLNDSEKFVVLTFDGMSLRSSLKYLEHDDRIIGFEDLDSFGSNSPNVAKSALQFMVRGVSTRWKQPVGHFFTGNSIGAETLKLMVQAIVSKLEEFDLKVATVVCDQEACHRACFTALGVITTKPFFQSESGNTVHVMYDPPHLMKNLRNNLLTYDFLVADKVVSFDHVVKLFELDSGNVLRCVPKLTRGHIELNNFFLNERSPCNSSLVSQRRVWHSHVH